MCLLRTVLYLHNSQDICHEQYSVSASNLRMIVYLGAQLQHRKNTRFAVM